MAGTTQKSAPESFKQRLARHDLTLERGSTSALQVNVGLVCNLSCGHCHLEAGPARSEMMERPVMDDVIAAAARLSFASIDVTGGAPELVPELPHLLRGLAPFTQRLIVRTNLVSLEGERGETLRELYRDLGVVLIASLPAANPAQTDAQRGGGVWERSMAALTRLNAAGYGMPGSPLELDLVSNPSGAFLPPPQLQAQEKFRRDLSRRHGVSFHNLYSFANAPLGRFRLFLERSGNLDAYLDKLASGFNPRAVSGVMCRSQLSVDWAGRLYDCDFHLSRGIAMGGRERLVRELEELPAPGTPIPAADHCYACTVGAGFT